MNAKEYKNANKTLEQLCGKLSLTKINAHHAKEFFEDFDKLGFKTDTQNAFDIIEENLNLLGEEYRKIKSQLATLKPPDPVKRKETISVEDQTPEIKHFVKTWLAGTTCQHKCKPELKYVSQDKRFIVILHHAHAEYIGGNRTKNCPVYFSLYDLSKTKQHTDCFYSKGEKPYIKKWETRWNNKYLKEIESLIISATNKIES